MPHARAYFAADLSKAEVKRLDQLVEWAASGKFYKPAALIGELEEWAWGLGARETAWIEEAKSKSS